MSNIILCGFMGCGKTTVGRELTELAKMRFIDTDEAIVQSAGLPINEIFRLYGEAHFRDLEHNICCELSEKDGLVIATGGGALTFERNVQALKASGKIILLDLDLAKIKARLSGDASRPLLNSPERDEVMQRLYTQRIPLYRACADAAVDGSLPPREVAINIMRAAGV